MRTFSRGLHEIIAKYPHEKALAMWSFRAPAGLMEEVDRTAQAADQSRTTFILAALEVALVRAAHPEPSASNGFAEIRIVASGGDAP